MIARLFRRFYPGAQLRAGKTAAVPLDVRGVLRATVMLGVKESR